MSKRPRFGDVHKPGRTTPVPPHGEDDPVSRVGAPLPLQTQPMAAVRDPDGKFPPDARLNLPANIHVAATQQISPDDIAKAMSGGGPGAPQAVAAGGRGAPQPMIERSRPLTPGGRIDERALAPEIARSIDGPRARAASSSPPPPSAQAQAQAAPAPVAAGRAPSPSSARTPPEIGLTQHHLPDDAPLDPRLILVTDPDSERAASYRVLRHHLLEAGRPQVVVVTSSRAGDGKTTVAVNLALALAECGRSKVLLVEAHVRRPQLASLFRLVPPWCFAEQLAAHRHQPLLPWGFVDIPQLWLHVAAINPRIGQTQLLDAPAFAIAMDRLRLGGYDHIVIDAPPVVGSADVNLIQDAADGTVLVIRGKRSTARDLRDAIEQLTPTRVLGTVLIET